MGEKIFAFPSSLLDFDLYPLSHICFSCLLRIVMELRIGPRSSRGEDWYNINSPPRIIKHRAWALNEGCCVEEYIFILTLSYMGMLLLLFGGQEVYSKMGAGRVNGRGNVCLSVFSPGFQLVSPQSHPFSLSFTACGGIVYRP